WKVPSTSAISQARQRLGSAPLKELFHRAAVPVAGLGTQGAWLRHRRLMAIDGTSFDVPDTEANVAAFGKMGSGPQQSAFPKLQVVSLSECGTHAMVAAAMGSCRTGERELASELAGHLDGDMLVTADSGFHSWQLWDLYSASDAALCWRVGASVALPLVRRLPDGSYLALIFAPNTPAKRKAALLAAARAGEQGDEDRARVVRAGEYTVPDRGGPDGELVCVITTILDPAELSAPEAAFAYYQRWEHESGLDEIKTHLRDWLSELSEEGDDADLLHRQLVHTLGNLTLSGYNSELSNNSFAAKRERLSQSGLVMNQEIAACYRWGKTEILARSDRLADRAIALWPGPE